MEWYLKVVRDNYANFNGRARRKEYWMFLLFNVLFAIAALVVDIFLGTDFKVGYGYGAESMGYGWVYTIYSLVVIIPSIAVGIRRLHDTGRSGWWVFISIIPLIGAIILFIFLCIDSTPGNNQYGPNPKSQKAEHVEENTVVDAEPTVIEMSIEPISLKVESGSSSGKIIRVNTDTTLGRAQDNDIIFEEKTVSGHHAKIVVDGDRFMITDLGSTNGTRVNGERVTQKHIGSGDVVSLSSIKIKVQ